MSRKTYAHDAGNGEGAAPGSSQERLSDVRHRLYGTRRGIFLSPSKVCQACGVPLSITRNHSWERDGRILSRGSLQRMVIVERKIVGGLLDRARERLGAEVMDTFVQAKAMDAFRYTRSLLGLWGRIMVTRDLRRRYIYDFLCQQSRNLGMADARVVDYRRGWSLVIACSQCYSEQLFQGDILGAVVACEDKGGLVRSFREGGEILFEVSLTGDDHHGIGGGYPFSWEPAVPGNRRFRRCSACGAPFSVSFLAWDMGRGLVVDTFSGEPVVFLDAASINVVHREMLARHGESVDGLLARGIKKLVDELLPGLQWKRRLPEDRVRDLFFLAYRGMGNPVCTEPAGDGILVRVENPFNYPVVAGITASFIGRGNDVEWEWRKAGPGVLEVWVEARDGKD